MQVQILILKKLSLNHSYSTQVYETSIFNCFKTLGARNPKNTNTLPQKAYLIAKGIFKGVKERLQLKFNVDGTEIMTCLHDSDELYIPDVINVCQFKSKEMIELQQILNQISSPWKLSFIVGYNLLIQGFDIYKDINIAINEWKSQNYEEFGQQIGSVLFQLLQGKEPKNITNSTVKA